MSEAEFQAQRITQSLIILWCESLHELGYTIHSHELFAGGDL